MKGEACRQAHVRPPGPNRANSELHDRSLELPRLLSSLLLRVCQIVDVTAQAGYQFCRCLNIAKGLLAFLETHLKGFTLGAARTKAESPKLASLFIIWPVMNFQGDSNKIAIWFIGVAAVRDQSASRV